MDDPLEQPPSSLSALHVLQEEEEEDVPTPDHRADGNGAGDDGSQSSGDEGEDGGLDWSKLPPVPSSAAAARPVIPKRGEKDFEPAPGGASGLQLHNLDRARDAMLAALRSTRATSSKSISHATWVPALARAHVTLARGIHFSSMGHSVARPAPSPAPLQTQTEPQKRPPKRLELLPEEALYLVEKGALLCSKTADDGDDDDGGGGGGAHVGAAPPMSVQQAFAEMLGRDGLSLEKYQVFSYLRRLGYVVTRARAPSPAYPVPAPYPAPYPARSPAAASPLWAVVRRIFAALFAPFASLARLVVGARAGPGWDAWRPLVVRPWWGCGLGAGVNADYAAIFRALRFIPAGHKAPLHRCPATPSASSAAAFSSSTTSSSSSASAAAAASSASSSPAGAPASDAAKTAAVNVSEREPEPAPVPDPDPYEVFFHLYKPATPFRKTAPPPPDFEVVVVNARTTPMPTLAQLAELYRSLPEIPPPLPRQRRPPPAPSTSAPAPSSLPPPPPPPSTAPPTLPPPASYLLTRLLPRLPFSRARDPSSGPDEKRAQSRAPPRANPFMALRQGTRTVVIAAVDAGVVSFFRLGEGAFEAWPMVG